MKRNWQKRGIGAAIALASVVLTLLLGNVRFFQLLDLKAQDSHFVFRGKVPTKDIVIIGIDENALNSFTELMSFWHPYYADAIRAAADGGAKTMVLDVAFGVGLSRYDPNIEPMLAEAYNYAAPTMPVITAFVASSSDQSNPAFAVPLNMMSSAFGTAAFANLTVDADDFVRRQVLIEAPKAGVDTATLTRGMAMRAVEKFTGKELKFQDGKIYLGNQLIPVDDQRNLTINFAGPADSFPKVSLVDFVQAARAHNKAQLEKWVKGKVVLLGPDLKTDDRHATPFYTAFGLTDKWRTAGVEIHADTIHTLLSGDFLKPVPEWFLVVSMLVTALVTVMIVITLANKRSVAWSVLVLAVGVTATHVLFRYGWLVSTVDLLLVYIMSVIGGATYRFITAEKKSSFFKSAVALFVGKEVARSLDASDKISKVGKREVVTIMFSDIRGFTAFCESKDPAFVVDLLNTYMGTMCEIIVRHGGHVNKFIGDGILAVFSDDDEGAAPGGHAYRAIACAVEMVTAPSEFKTGTGMHSGEVVIGNVGSSEKMEYTVLGDTVNLASRLESLNKENKTKLLMSGTTHEMLAGRIDTYYLGAVPVRGKTEPMKLYTVGSLVTDEIRAHAAENAAQEAVLQPVGAHK